MSATIIRLQEYLQAMHDWEKGCAERLNAALASGGGYFQKDEVAMPQYMEIFNKYCSKAATPRSFTFGTPPDHDPIRQIVESEVELTPTIVEIRTRQSYSPGKVYTFRLVSEDGEWRVAKRVLHLSTSNIDAGL